MAYKAEGKFEFEILEDLGIVGRSEGGYTKKLILAKWYGKPPIYELRSFAPDGTPKKRCGLTPEELTNLVDLLVTQ